MSKPSPGAARAGRSRAAADRGRRWRVVVAIAAIGATTGRGAGAQGADAVVLQACAALPGTEAVLAELNARRAQAVECGAAGRFDAAGPLHWDDRLARTAQAQAAAVASQRKLSHRVDGADLGSRLQAVTYLQVHAAENLAAGPTTLSAALSRWMASAPHCANLMAPYLLDAGVGCAIGGDADGVPIHYWALILGEPRLPGGRLQTVSASP